VATRPKVKGRVKEKGQGAEEKGQASFALPSSQKDACPSFVRSETSAIQINSG
jgi:hypothetical protein